MTCTVKKYESISFATGLEECELAEIIIDLARANPSEHPTLLQESITSHSMKFGDKSVEISESPDFVSEHGATRHFTHIGEYLIGKKRNVFEKRIGYHPDFKTSVNRWVLKHASRVYFSGILLLSILILVVLFLVIQLPKILSVFPLIIGGSPGIQCNIPWVYLCFLLPFF